MNLKGIYKPIKNQLFHVENELASIVGSYLSKDSIDEILNCFFKIQGKRLRPALTLLCAGLVNQRLGKDSDHKLIKLCVALELIHSTSLIHDDIIDDDTLRRGQETLNSAYGRKIAVLAGDVLYARSFSVLSTELPKEFGQRIVNLTEDMCRAEIKQAKEQNVTKSLYLSIVQGKTAGFMSVCCQLGGLLAGANLKETQYLAEFGLNLGMTYQLMDDIIDEDMDKSLDIGMKDAEIYATKALKAISSFEETPYKQSLINFVHYILSFSHQPMAKKIV